MMGFLGGSAFATFYTFLGIPIARMADQGVKLSVNDFVIKACAQALQRVPEANSVWAGDRILAGSAVGH